MRTLLLLILLLPVSALAQSTPPTNVLVIPDTLGASYWANDLSRVDVIGKELGNQMYFSYDRSGRANGMGLVNQPFAPRPLIAPAVPRPSPR